MGVPKLNAHKSGGYWFNVRINGKQRYCTVPGPGKREALKQQLDRIRELQEAREPTVLTTGEWIEHWHATKSFETHNTRKAYGDAVARIRPQIGSIPLAELSARHIREMYLAMSATLSPATMSLTHSMLKMALQMAEDDEEIVKSPARSVKSPGSRSPEMEPFTKEEARRIVEVSQSSTIHTAVLLGLYAGLRVGEVCGLRWQELDLERGTLTVRQQIRKEETGYMPAPPKTAKGKRAFTISETLQAALVKHRGAQAETRLLMGDRYRNEDFVLSKIDGTCCRPTSVSRAFGRLLTRHEIRPLTFHALRHTHITLCLENREDLRTVSERAGHSTPAFTAAVYGHVTPEMDEGLARRFDALLR